MTGRGVTAAAAQPGPEPWRVLALDTATGRAGVALVEGAPGPAAPRPSGASSDRPEEGSESAQAQAQVVASAWSERGAQHSASLLPLADALLRATGWTPESLTGVAVTVGPGSFTGLRIGVTTAKGLAYGWGKPIFPVDTLSVLAAQAAWGMRPLRAELAVPLTSVRIGAVLRSRRGEFYFQLFGLPAAWLVGPPTPTGTSWPSATVRPEPLGEPEVLSVSAWQRAAVPSDGEESSESQEHRSEELDRLLVVVGETDLVRELRPLWPTGRGRWAGQWLRWAGEEADEWGKPEPGTVGRLAVVQLAMAQKGLAALAVVPRYCGRAEV